MITVGVDLGGSRIRAAIFDGERELGRVEAPGAAMRLGQGKRLAELIHELLHPLLLRRGIARTDQLTVGASGAGAEAERHELQEALEAGRLAWRVQVTTDAELSRRAAFGSSPGVLLIAGTGSIVVGRDYQGAAIRSGGLGWRMGDLGSGYWIGSAALQAVGAMYDHLGGATRLLETLPPAIGAAGVAGLIRWSVTATPAQVAALTPVVVTTAQYGDEASRKILQQAAGHLVQISLAAGAATLPVALTGGLIDPDGPLRERVAAELTRAGAELHPARVDPCRGALTRNE